MFSASGGQSTYRAQRGHVWRIIPNPMRSARTADRVVYANAGVTKVSAKSMITSTTPKLTQNEADSGVEFPGKVDTEIRAMRGSDEVVHGQANDTGPADLHAAVQEGRRPSRG